MDFEQALETRRLRLLRILAGLVCCCWSFCLLDLSRAAFRFGPAAYVGSILSRAELAARCLVIAQAKWIMDRRGVEWDCSRFTDDLTRVFETPEADLSPSKCRARLKALRAVLMDLPRHASGPCCIGSKNRRGGERPARIVLRLGSLCGVQLSCAIWRLAANLIERPPDKSSYALPRLSSPSSGFRTEGADGWAL